MSTGTHPASAGSARPSAASSPGASPWIQGPVADLLLYVGTPLLILPAVLVLTSGVAPKSLYLGVAAFGALGHHLPGMMRAYGDRALFERFRTRFIVAPLFLLAVCISLTLLNPKPLIAVTYCWGVWHGLMQTHGLMRIYDAKRGSFARLTARLDHLMVLTWFVAGVLFSPTRVPYLLEALYGSGAPLVSADALGSARLAWGVLTALVTAAFLVNLARSFLVGRPQSLVKLLLLATSIAFWTYSNVFVAHLLVGIILFEIFHDVQYLAIVWKYNRGRVEKDPRVGAFSRYVFRRSGAMVCLYVALVFAYGSLRFVQSGLEARAEAFLASVLGGVLVASTLLHFYYDGFIWKVRERSTRQSLGLAGGSEAGAARPGLQPWTVHGLKWGLFVVPVVLLTLAPLGSPPGEVAALRSMAELSPTSKQAWYNLGVGLREAGDRAGARDAFEHALGLGPYDAELDESVRVNLTWSLVELGEEQLRRGQRDAAREALGRAREVQPALVGLLEMRARQAAESGDAEALELACRSALCVDAEHAPSHYNLAVALGMLGRVDEALRHAAEFRRLRPDEEVGDALLASLKRRPSGGL